MLVVKILWSFILLINFLYWLGDKYSCKKLQLTEILMCASSNYKNQATYFRGIILFSLLLIDIHKMALRIAWK